MRSLALLSGLAILTMSTLAKAEDRAPRFSLGLERVASLNAVFFSVDQDEDEFGLRAKGLTVGGPIQNPLAAPRLAFDYISPSGLTFGTGLAFGLGDLDSSDNGHDTDEGGFNLLMLNPRIGYRIPLGDVVDLTPRVGATLGWASFTGPEYESCDYSYDPQTDVETEDCAGQSADTVNLFAAVVNLEVAAAFRLTDSFNLLTGVSYDLLVAAHAEEDDGGSGDSDGESFKDGHLSSLQLWFGLGGYL